ncbi:SCO0930 family lipoprotein [Nocardiopsis ansamitocini]|uniref:Lipoprotein with Yx(FWY)xxD motif n=1 Tax=Nocardiopsis ansamitocini TaxID=1670832 RepID=A0A9W6P4J4_9ACTN|nr:SCO0930 family lipoprotein [Nocardiopsis ansamitocini]GLU46959.1 hypothetical protein Nans01_13100 [Nocardiopsis ansamitocini]
MNSTMRRRALTASAASAVVLLASSCGLESLVSAGADAIQEAQPTGSGLVTGVSGQVSAADAGELGTILVNGEQETLYRFDNDTADPSASNCAGDCAAAWPPVLAENASAVDIPDPSLLGEVTRADGTKQLTIAGWPMYLFAKDEGPGDVKGQGVNGVWWAVTGEGGRAGQSEAPQQPEASQPATGAVSAAQDSALGAIVKDAENRTLYRFDDDTAWPMVSNCDGECTETWKPAKPADAASVQGIAPELISTLVRADGTEQLAIDCWPVYWFTKDTEADPISGHGVGGTWWAITPDGTRANNGQPLS